MNNKKDSPLSTSEMEMIYRNERELTSIVTALEKVRKFKLEDILIAFRPESTWSKREQVLNSYGAPKKYKVVYIDKLGIPYVKELNRNNNTVGYVKCPIDFDGYGAEVNLEFEVDPELTDAIIFDEVANYNPTESSKARATLFQEIVAHNKQARCKFTNSFQVVTWLNTLKQGDTIWRTSTSYWTITSIIPVPVTPPPPGKQGGKINYGATFMTVQNQKGEILKLSFNDVSGKALYKSQPRSYKKELNHLK